MKHFNTLAILTCYSVSFLSNSITIPVDESATHQYASSNAKLFWPSNSFENSLPNLEKDVVADFSVEDIDKARKIIVPLKTIPTSNDIIFVMSVLPPKSGAAHFFSKEGSLTKAPTLSFTINGATQNLAPMVDTYLNHTTQKPLGIKNTFKVSNSDVAILKFTLPPKKITSKISDVKLILYTTEKQFGDTNIQVTAINNVLPDPSAETNGIAQKYKQDIGLQNAPQVYYADNFNQYNLVHAVKTWFGLTSSAWSNTGDLNFVDHTAVDHFSEEHGKALIVPFTTKFNLAQNLDYYFSKQNQQEPEDAYFRYYLRLDPNAFASGGGKLPGFSGTYESAGWGGRANNGYNGWSARGAFFASMDKNLKKWPSRLPIGSYLYEVDNKNKYGRTIPWGNEKSLLIPGRWYSIEQHLKLNTPNIANGILEVWIDGKKIVNRNNLHFRNTKELKIEKVWFNFYFGGVDKPKQNFEMYMDNIVIASSYIGPIKK